MLVLQNHYDGKSAGERSKQVAKDDLKKLFYSNKTTFSFGKYITKMKQTFNVLENYNFPLVEEDKVRKILDNIDCPNKNLKTVARSADVSLSFQFFVWKIYVIQELPDLVLLI